MPSCSVRAAPQVRQAVYGDKDQAARRRAPEFKNVAETYGKLRAFVDWAPGRNWNDATSLVIQGKAGFQVMGEWAKGEFIAAGQTAGKEYGCAILSNKGTGGYAMGGDVFAFPKTKDPAALKAQVTLAKVLLDPETQLMFNKKKGSIPARQDVDVSSMDVCAQKAVKMIADKSQQAPAQELLTPPAVTGAVEDVISSFWNNPGQSTDTFAQKFGEALKQI